MPARHDSERRKTRAREPTGKSRKKAPKGLNLPLQNDVLDVMVTHFEDVYRDVRLHVLPIASAQLLLALPLTVAMAMLDAGASWLARRHHRAPKPWFMTEVESLTARN